MRLSNQFGFSELDPLPGCSQVVVSHNSVIYKEHRGLGHGTRANKFRIEKAKFLGYDYILCTVDGSNEAQLRILKNNGWKKLDSFDSRKTGHNVIIFGKRLNTKVEKDITCACGKIIGKSCIC
jgi:RimJ/RimL family protein N-acetyltransferase